MVTTRSGNKMTIEKISEIYLREGTLTDDEIASAAAQVDELSKKNKRSSEEDAFILDYLTTTSRLLREKMQSNNTYVEPQASGSGTPSAPREPIPILPPDSREPSLFSQRAKAVINLKESELVCKPEKFNGTKPEPRIWFEEFEDAYEANGWS